MIHIQAVGAGIVILMMMLFVALLVANYPVIGFGAVTLLVAYCIGRGALEVISGKRR